MKTGIPQVTVLAVPGVSFRVAVTGQPSWSKDKKRVQVTGFVTADVERRYIHKHLRQFGGSLVGSHPDPRVPQEHADMEAEVSILSIEVTVLKGRIEADDEILAKEKIPEGVMKRFAQEIKQKRDAVRLAQDRGLVPSTRFGEMVAEALMPAVPASESEAEVRAFIQSRREARIQELEGPAERLENAKLRLAQLRATKPKMVAYTLSH